MFAELISICNFVQEKNPPDKRGFFRPEPAGIISGDCQPFFFNIQSTKMEIKMFLEKFASWLHSAFIPANHPDNWERRDGSEILHTNELQSAFLRENPEISMVLGKMGLLALALLFSLSGKVNAETAPRPVGITADTLRTDTLSPVPFKIIRKVKPV